MSRWSALGRALLACNLRIGQGMNRPRYFLVMMGILLALVSPGAAQLSTGNQEGGNHETHVHSPMSSNPLEKTSGAASQGTSNSTGKVGWIRPGSDSPRSGADTPWKTRYLVSLLIVGGLMAGGFMGLKRLQSRLPGLGFSGAEVRVVGRVALDQRTTLFVIRLQGEELVLSTGPSQVNVLSRRPVEPEEGGG